MTPFQLFWAFLIWLNTIYILTDISQINKKLTLLIEALPK